MRSASAAIVHRSSGQQHCTAVVILWPVLINVSAAKKPRNEIASLIAAACEQCVSLRGVRLDEKSSQTFSALVRSATPLRQFETCLLNSLIILTTCFYLLLTAASKRKLISTTDLVTNCVRTCDSFL